VLKMVAARGEGVDELVAAIDKHRAWALDSGAGLVRRERRAAEEIEALAMATVRRRLTTDPAVLSELSTAVAAGLDNPYDAADRLLAGVGWG
jgi:LAO/AO transport system kinase